MKTGFRSLLHGPLFQTRTDLEPMHAASRISAYIYGNILILAALVPISPAAIGLGLAVVWGTALSTYVAHAFAETVGESVRQHADVTWELRISELRDSVPILTSAVVPSVVLLLGILDVLEPETAQLTAEIVMLARIGGIAFVIARLKGQRPGGETIIASVFVIIIALAAVITKIVLTH
ncbi:hypothetical protein [Aldersonia kunmingensis]|uniref:hypothetical protein n=1 Tax=Aldersonia kunmingensis TaxID=408066 RepID=UPI00082D9D42|nr:hypothetical protein [Aldersonia kunmingensis]